MDIDETMLHAFFGPSARLSKVLASGLFESSVVFFQNGQECTLVYRPGLFDFLRTVRRQFDGLCIFTAGNEEYSRVVAKALSRRANIRFDHVWSRDHCTTVQDVETPFYTKDLESLGLDVRRTVLVDNRALNFYYQAYNGILVNDFVAEVNTDGLRDTTLATVLSKLNAMSTYQDVRTFVKECMELGHEVEQVGLGTIKESAEETTQEECTSSNTSICHLWSMERQACYGSVRKQVAACTIQAALRGCLAGRKKAVCEMDWSRQAALEVQRTAAFFGLHVGRWIKASVKIQSAVRRFLAVCEYRRKADWSRRAALEVQRTAAFFGLHVGRWIRAATMIQSALRRFLAVKEREERSAAASLIQTSYRLDEINDVVPGWEQPVQVEEDFSVTEDGVEETVVQDVCDTVQEVVSVSRRRSRRIRGMRRRVDYRERILACRVIVEDGSVEVRRPVRRSPRLRKMKRVNYQGMQ